MENLSPPTTPGHKIKAVMGRARRKKPTSSGPKKPVTRGDPNRARNERKIELAFLREKVAQLELELTALMLHPRSQTRALRHEGEKRQVTKQEAVLDSTMSVYDPVQIPTVWKEVAGRQRRRREKAERENVRLKLILEHQIKMAKGLESLLQKRAKQQVGDSRLSVSGEQELVLMEDGWVVCCCCSGAGYRVLELVPNERVQVFARTHV